jgi:HD-GYP domain-containing protein (c-di-GMP phosphodiesterase class II)
LVEHLGDLLVQSSDEFDGSLALEAEPQPRRMVPESGIDDLARVFADFTDLKSPFLSGHSTGVARLAELAADAAGLSNVELLAVRRAGLLDDTGRLGVPNGIWDKPGALTSAQWERVRLHPY